MAVNRIDLPAHFNFHCTIPIRISDLNYGNHVGNDTVLTLIHEARMQYLASLGYTEMNMEGYGMIMSDVAINFKNEIFYGDTITVGVAATDLSRAAFNIVYKLEKDGNDAWKTVAIARTGMVCYDYDRKKIISLPEKARLKLSQ